jgi:ATP/maltotriose-dependent transcriptional regulator MalT
MTGKFCPRCHQPLRFERAGVRLTERKAAILDAIKASGDVGLSSQELAYALRVTKTCVKSHVWQLNAILEETDWHIVADGRRWCLVRRRRVAH